MMKKINSEKAGLFMIGGVSLLTLVIVFVSQYGFQLQPCQLCYWERIPYYGAVLLAGLGLLLPRPVQRWVILGLALIFVGSFVLGGFHVGVEWKWWEGLQGCSGSIEKGLTMDELRMALMDAPPVPCNEPQGVLLGISMAGYNTLLSLFIAVFAGKYFFQAKQE